VCVCVCVCVCVSVSDGFFFGIGFCELFAWANSQTVILLIFAPE
jgi:hypothetical protein